MNKVRETSSKLEYKYYIGKIITGLNSFRGSGAELMDRVAEIKQAVMDKEKEVRERYDLSLFVPTWSQFTLVVIDRCLQVRRSKQRLTYSLLNTWIQEFKEKTTTVKGFEEAPLVVEDTVVPSGHFSPIVLVAPPL